MMMPPEPCPDCNKLVYIISETGTDRQVRELLDALELEDYTLFEQIKGSGETGRKDGDAIFPGINNVIMIAMDEERIPELVHGLHEIRDSFIIQPGMKVIVTDCVMY
jgi:hypothetical protein